MHFEGEFSVPGVPDDVIRRFADVERMVRCMAGAVFEGRDAEGNYLGSMLVAFGPKKIKFRGRVAVETDFVAHSGSLRGRGAADMRAARIEVRIAYVLRCDPAKLGTTLVKLTSDAELGGVLADFARTGGIPFAKALMVDFSKRVAEEFATDAPSQAAPSEPAPLAAHGLLWQVIKAKLIHLAGWLGFMRA
jgi:carbon monoxide dehydrogenase subunit G